MQLSCIYVREGQVKKEKIQSSSAQELSDKESWAALLRERGLKATPIRLHLLSILKSVHHRAQSVEDLASSLKKRKLKADRVSLYRSLAQMEKVGLLEKRSLSSQRMGYELAASDDDHCHHHIVCRSCDRVDLVPECQKKHLSGLAKKLGYQLLDHQLELQGLCRKCQ